MKKLISPLKMSCIVINFFVLHHFNEKVPWVEFESSHFLVANKTAEAGEKLWVEVEWTVGRRKKIARLEKL